MKNEWMERAQECLEMALKREAEGLLLSAQGWFDEAVASERRAKESA